MHRCNVCLGETVKTLTAVTARRFTTFFVVRIKAPAGPLNSQDADESLTGRRSVNYRPLLLISTDFKQPRCHLTPAWTDRTPPFVHLRL